MTVILSQVLSRRGLVVRAFAIASRQPLGDKLRQPLAIGVVQVQKTHRQTVGKPAHAPRTQHLPARADRRRGVRQLKLQFKNARFGRIALRKGVALDEDARRAQVGRRVLPNPRPVVLLDKKVNHDAPRASPLNRPFNPVVTGGGHGLGRRRSKRGRSAGLLVVVGHARVILWAQGETPSLERRESRHGRQPRRRALTQSARQA